MPFQWIRDLAKQAVNRRNFPHADIARGSRVTGDTTIGAHVKIEEDCYVFNSQLGDHVYLQRRCNLFETELESHNVVYAGSELNNVSFGSFTYISNDSALSNARVGRFCSIGPQVLCGVGDHPVDLLSTSPVFYSLRNQCGISFAGRQHLEENKITTIGHDVWIGARVFLRDGTNIGHGAVAAAGAVIVNDVPDYAIVGGVPAKVIRYRFAAEVIQELLEIRWWNWTEEKLRAAQTYMVHSDVASLLEWARNAQEAQSNGQ